MNPRENRAIVPISAVLSAQSATFGNADDARTALGLIDDMDDVASFAADAAYDTIAIYDAAAERGAKVIVPPRVSATRSTRSCARDRTVRRVRKVGLRQWKKESGYHRQARVENTFSRYKSIVGDRLRARHRKSPEAEALIACNMPEPDDGAWLARVLRDRRLNQAPETENPATRHRFMHQRPKQWQSLTFQLSRLLARYQSG